MKHVDIFITHNMTSLKARRAAYVYVIYALTSKGDATCSAFGMEQNVTVNRINLYAFCSALAHFTNPAEITVIRIPLCLQVHLTVEILINGRRMVFRQRGDALLPMQICGVERHNSYKGIW